jgi:ParB-like chromosome segregation protein Spo0J
VAEHVPLERLKPAPWNPKTIRDDRFVSLCRSIEADPAFMDEQPILAMADGTIYSGNQRYRAVEHLGWTTVPARLADIPESLAQRRGMVANNQWGDWIDDDLGALLASLGDAGTDLSLLGFEDGELERLLAQVQTATVEAPEAFAEYDESLETAYECPKCHYEWSGKPKPDAS